MHPEVPPFLEPKAKSQLFPGDETEPLRDCRKHFRIGFSRIVTFETDSCISSLGLHLNNNICISFVILHRISVAIIMHGKYQIEFCPD